MSGIPGSKRITEALAELITNGLGYESHRHLTEAYIHVQSSGSSPAEALVSVKELLNMPTLWVIDGQIDNLISIARGEKGFVVEAF